ncbi:hypothetical protein NG99_24435 [Erwinia typographi]|uniref:Uncharacterized protein n=1 Tax=Erwinia typographi TaxID=371042 RepID=A0A0A3YK89_9GAMM|nr:hypothetical protein NG99_24435 [Erwinia typographi]
MTTAKTTLSTARCTEIIREIERSSARRCGLYDHLYEAFIAEGIINTHRGWKGKIMRSSSVSR